MNIPILLILFRLVLAPIILLLAYFIGENAKLAIIILMYLGLISDILDGIIARKNNTSSAKLRRMDSQTDMIFWFIGFNYAGIPFELAIFFGILSHIDRILITLILPKWTHDIPSTYHAILIRKGIKFKKNIYFNG